MTEESLGKVGLLKHSRKGSINIDSTELTSYIQSVLNGIKNSQDGSFKLKTNVDFELSIVTKKTGGNTIILFLVGLHDKTNDEKISKIKFSMGLDEVIE